MDPNKNLSLKMRQLIDSMSLEQLARKWRFTRGEDLMLQGDAGEYFQSRLFKHFGGIPPELSKKIGW